VRVCLIHGSTQSTHGWDLLVHELMAWGVDVCSVDLPVDRPQEGAEFYASQVAAQLPTGEDPPVVVAHSAAGLILPAVAARMPVAALVYLAAVVPLRGMSLIDQFLESKEMFHPDWVGKDPTKDHSIAAQYLFHDCDERTLAWALTTLRLWSAPGVLKEQCITEKFPEVPTTYISATGDRTINAEWWEQAALERLGVKPIRIDSGHAPHVSRPREVADLIMQSGG
jgi:pimeloyl-ACP methyl ester carboxylesterase